ncbi:uncharacterized protein CC84DRAFT_1161491 [Paraphaeosphaeria sporulosa]|uniref:Uncharacterized protein n=1 Tax=Paraphaeosphaeria sporulosa TaxID=1460663 RepID=A0A177CSR1_9PLEO|nr:uncharacterized protein CC84DRAFT_1161491 [Paraphaeosphaeria sporulosa]OAG10574.1 hypothetical protein CC84DRAFT_1161491 [Paraphaeosphaeria sporulosa]
MPIDRTSNNPARPLKPTLATTRTSKTPVAPRLAPAVASTPAARTARSAAGTTPRVHTAVYEDVTPVKAFISSNVTPRSSSRKSRVGGSANSTPSGTPSTTPIASRPASTVDYPQKEPGPGYGQAGYGPNGFGGAQRRPRSTVGTSNHQVTSTPRLPLSNIYSNAPEPGRARGPSGSSMFFHANDARTTPEPQQPPQKKSPVFFYANGDQDASAPSPTAPSPPLSAVGRMQAESKFFHANSLPDHRDSPPALTPPPISASPEPWASLHPADSQHALRPPSPAKENIHLSYRKGASQVIRPNLQTRNSALSIISGFHGSDVGADNSTRRSSVTSAVRFSHAKSASLSSIDSVQSLKKNSAHDQPHITPSPLHNEKRVVSTGSLPESVAAVPTETMTAMSALPSPNGDSPTKLGPGGKSMLEHMNELAANARRERKVLDLEISNNSLLAINRSLEREMRKQKAELRRFRRMSRAGRFTADTISSLEEFSAVGVSELGDLSDMSDDEPDEVESEDHSDSSFDESAMSEGALAERDEAHRLRDEKRLRLDLSKHRELLADSAKMNQSLKRCLNWTEELIKDGQKALAYQVRVSDVQLGGRVLEPEEQPEADQDEESHGLLSPWSPPHRELNPMDGSPPSNPDRDSGIDIDGMKSAISGLQSFISPLASPL